MSISRDALLSQLRQSLADISEATDLPFPGTPLVVAVSGGPDSLALIHALGHFIPKDELIVAHMDHQLRPESAADELYVRKIMERWQLPYTSQPINVSAIATRNKMGIEEAARLVRYEFLIGIANQIGAEVIVTGHNADDQAETVLMHILRGSGLSGLAGMQPVGLIGEDPELWLLRPLLQTSRADIEKYCRKHDLRPLTDESNTDPAFTRNRLRHELMPILRTYNPKVDERLLNLSAVAAADYELLDELTIAAMVDLVQGFDEGWVMLDRTMWLDLPLSLRRSTLRVALLQLLQDQLEIGFDSIELARLSAELPRSGQQAHLPGGAVLHVTADQLVISATGDFPTMLAPQVPDGPPLRLPIPGKVALADGRVLSAKIVKSPRIQGIAASSDSWEVQVALPAKAELIVRGRLASERMQPLGMNGRSRTLKQIMIDRKIPEPLRSAWPVVVANEQVVWLVGHAVDHRYRVTEASGTVVRLRCE